MSEYIWIILFSYVSTEEIYDLDNWMHLGIEEFERCSSDIHTVLE
jgi:hypothetical protein